jgi:hypothetical protein
MLHPNNHNSNSNLPPDGCPRPPTKLSAAAYNGSNNSEQTIGRRPWRLATNVAQVKMALLDVIAGAAPAMGPGFVPSHKDAFANNNSATHQVPA